MRVARIFGWIVLVAWLAVVIYYFALPYGHPCVNDPSGQYDNYCGQRR